MKNTAALLDVLIYALPSCGTDAFSMEECPPSACSGISIRHAADFTDILYERREGGAVGVYGRTAEGQAGTVTTEQ